MDTTTQSMNTALKWMRLKRADVTTHQSMLTSWSEAVSDVDRLLILRGSRYITDDILKYSREVWSCV